jgi:hypothetical protein
VRAGQQSAAAGSAAIPQICALPGWGVMVCR